MSHFTANLISGGGYFSAVFALGFIYGWGMGDYPIASPPRFFHPGRVLVSLLGLVFSAILLSSEFYTATIWILAFVSLSTLSLIYLLFCVPFQVGLWAGHRIRLKSPAKE
jgi:hypothetical protein